MSVPVGCGGERGRGGWGVRRPGVRRCPAQAGLALSRCGAVLLAAARMATRTQRAPSVKRPQPPYSALYSRTTARTKARKEKRSETGKHKLIYAAKDARALSEMEWRCVMLTWAVTGWRCKCPPERLSRFTCNCMPSWTPAEARCACPLLMPLADSMPCPLLTNSSCALSQRAAHCNIEGSSAQSV